MTNERILKKAIEKAIENGYKYGEHLIEWIEEKDEQWGTLMDSTSVETIIFSHNFAKAFWKGEKCTCIPDIDMEGSRYHKQHCKMTTPDWRCHLQQMVLEEDPIKYLEKFL